MWWIQGRDLTVYSLTLDPLPQHPLLRKGSCLPHPPPEVPTTAPPGGSRRTLSSAPLEPQVQIQLSMLQVCCVMLFAISHNATVSPLQGVGSLVNEALREMSCPPQRRCPRQRLTSTMTSTERISEASRCTVEARARSICPPSPTPIIHCSTTRHR